MRFDRPLPGDVRRGVRLLGTLIALATFACMAWYGIRLARFNANIAVIDKRYFQGLPSPSGAAVVVGFLESCEIPAEVESLHVSELPMPEQAWSRAQSRMWCAPLLLMRRTLKVAAELVSGFCPATN